jgi:hypothetical protein
MSKRCDEVIGLDFSHRFVHAANAIKNDGKLAYWRWDEAGLKTCLSAHVPSGADPARVSFVQGDAMQLPEGLGRFDRLQVEPPPIAVRSATRPDGSRWRAGDGNALHMVGDIHAERPLAPA